MILEIEDIIEHKRGMTHAAIPKGLTLGKIFEQDERLQKLKTGILQVSLNGVKIDNWEGICAGKHDRVKITLGPNFAIAALIPIFQAIIAIVSIVSFFISLFNQPKTPTGKGAGGSATYGFEGIHDTLPIGDPVPWVYGIHKKGGQVLQYFVDVDSLRTGQSMGMLLAMAEGEITSLSNIEVNGLPIESISSAQFDMRMGLSSQSIIPGFERIRNTFFDGREISDPNKQKNRLTSNIVYRTVGNNIESVDLQVEAFNGIANLSFKSSAVHNLTVNYSVERKSQTTADSPANWTIVASPRAFSAATRRPIFDVFAIPFSPRGAYDIRLTWLNIPTGNQQFPGNVDESTLRWRLRLKNVTEYQDVAGSYSNTALLAVTAIANQQLQGGRPNVTAVAHGKLVRVYSGLNSFAIQHSQNPAWGILDYMTNSIYGMGPYISLSDVDLQSFIDFATLADSQCASCGDK